VQGRELVRQSQDTAPPQQPDRILLGAAGEAGGEKMRKELQDGAAGTGPGAGPAHRREQGFKSSLSNMGATRSSRACWMWQVQRDRPPCILSGGHFGRRSVGMKQGL